MSIEIQEIGSLKVQWVGKRNHRTYGFVDTYIRVPGSTIHYMMPKCQGCGCREVLSSHVVNGLCFECGNLRNRFYTRMSLITSYNNKHANLAPDAWYKMLEEFVDEYKRRCDAGLKVPQKLDQADFMVKYWKGEVTNVGL